MSKSSRSRDPEPTSATALREVDDSPLEQAFDRSIDAVIAQARSDRTRRAYAWQWSQYVSFCRAHQWPVLASDQEKAARIAARYLVARAEQGWSVATLAQALAALSEGFRAAGQRSPREWPLVREAWRGIKRRYGAPARRVAPLVVSELRAVVRALEAPSLRSHPRRARRDRALLVLGFAGALRRSELCALMVSDVTFTNDGVLLVIRRSKTDPHAEGTIIGLPYGSDARTCPVRSLRAWLDDAKLDSGPLFRAVDRHGNVRGALSGHDVARIVRAAVARAGLDASRYSGHSLRAGLATSAARAGKSDRAIMLQGRWSSRSMVDRYVREATLLSEDNAATGIGL
jgi:integrase